MIFVEPGSVNMEPMAGEGHHGVVGQYDPDEENQRHKHVPYREQNTFHASVS